MEIGTHYQYHSPALLPDSRLSGYHWVGRLTSHEKKAGPFCQCFPELGNRAIASPATDVGPVPRMCPNGKCGIPKRLGVLGQGHLKIDTNMVLSVAMGASQQLGAQCGNPIADSQGLPSFTCRCFILALLSLKMLKIPTIEIYWVN